MRQTLADCEPFENNRSLRSVFADKRISPWRNNLPQADTLMERVDNVISYLHDKKHRDGSNALVSLLLVLAETIPDDGRREGLRNLADELVRQAADLLNPGMPQRKNPVPPAEIVQPVFSAGAEPQHRPTGKRDFFISYNRHDKDWAEWIAWQLEHAGYTTFIQAWDFRPGGNFVADMQEATTSSERTIAVLSQTYLSSQFTLPEWNDAFARDPSGKKGLLLPIKVRACEPKGLLSQIVYIDLTDLSAEQAAERLLSGVKRRRAKPSTAPSFPRTMARAEPPFPENT
jgi:hypothetical protein